MADERERLSIHQRSRHRHRRPRTFLRRLFDRHCTRTDVVYDSAGWQEAAAHSLHLNGACVIRQSRIKASLLERARNASLARLDELLRLAQTVSSTQRCQYRELWSRSDDRGHRFDLKVLPSSREAEGDAELSFHALRAAVDAIVQPILRALRNEDGESDDDDDDEETFVQRAAAGHISSVGCVVSLPGGPSQGWHTDGEERGIVNVFCPLVDISSRNGPTQLMLGTHQRTFSSDGTTHIRRGTGYLAAAYSQPHGGP